MPDIPEYLLKKAKEREQELGVKEDANAPSETPAAETPTNDDATPTEAATTPEAAPPAASTAAGDSGPITEDRDGVPAYLLERSRQRRAVLAGQDPNAGASAAPAPAAAGGGGGGGGGTATITRPLPTATGPDGHTQRLLTVVKSGSIQQTKAEAQDKVHTWPHLLAIEFASLLGLTAAVIIFSALVRAPLLGLADINSTPNPSKAPWYFLGLQELLTMFDPMIAGVTIPGIGLMLLAFAPYIDKNPDHKPSKRKFAICLFTMFLMFWATLTIIGSFFRGPGFNFILPWRDGIFFEL